MRKLNPYLHLRPLLRRIASSSTTTTTIAPNPSFLSPPPNPPFPLSSTTNNRLYPPTFSLSRAFCSQPHPIPTTPQDEDQELADSLSAELLKNPDEESLSVEERLQLSYSHVKLTPALVRKTLDVSTDASRRPLDFFKWVKSRSDFKLTDEVYSYFVQYLGRRYDFKAIHDLLVEGKGVVGEKCFESTVDLLVRAGREKHAVSLFENMESDYGFVRSLDKLKVIVTKLCEHGFSNHAEKMVTNWASDFFPDDYICDMVIKGWCVRKKLDEALRFAGEMYRGGFELSTFACNQILDCVCWLCRRKDPFRLESYSEKVLYGMEERGIPRDVETFNVLINNLCKIRKTEDAMKLFRKMGEWGCHPNETTFLVLIKSLYQAARVGEGDEMIDRMKSAGYGFALNKKEYYIFLKRLCGISRINHAMSVFAMMKADGFEPDRKIYDLLMYKLVAHGLLGEAKDLYKEAANSGVPVKLKAYKVNPRFSKKERPVVKKEEKRETLPEKMARKRKTLRKIRLSFVKKPRSRNRRRRAY